MGEAPCWTGGDSHFFALEQNNPVAQSLVKLQAAPAVFLPPHALNTIPNKSVLRMDLV